MKKLLLLGGGHAHLEVLRALGSSPLASAQVALVTPSARHIHAPLIAGWVAGRHGLDDIVIPWAPLAERAGVQLIEGAVVALDASDRRVALADGRTIDYDVLSIADEAVIDRDAMAGAREHALFLRPFDRFIRLWVSMLELAAQRSLNVVVVGGEAAGVELALAVSHRLSGSARVALVTGGDGPMAAHAPAVQRRMRQALRRARVTVFQDRCTAIRRGLVQLSQGMRLACDAPLIATEPCAPAWLAASGLALDAGGRIETLGTLQSRSHPEVLALGETASRAGGMRLDGGREAMALGAALTANLRRLVGGGELLRPQPAARRFELWTCGDAQALAQWGPLTLHGRWVRHWNDRRERAFVARHQPMR